MRVPRVFVSFASEDVDWKNNFIHPERFGGLMENVQVIDYQMGDNLPYGPLNQWLDDEVQAAAAIVCLVSRDYIKKKYTLKEWWAGVSEAKKRNLIFVPVMIDADAKQWWKAQKQEGKLHELSPDDDYAYANFTDLNGRRFEIVTKYGTVDAVTQKIRELARLIGRHLRQPAGMVELPRDDAQPPEQPAEPGGIAVPRPDEQLVTLVGEPEDRPVLVLGHPSSALSESVARNADQLVAALSADDLVSTRWKDGWRAMQSGSHGAVDILQKKPIVVQPVEAIEARDHAQTPTLLGNWLKVAGATEGPQTAACVSDCDLTVWLPQELDSPAFDEAVAAQAEDAKRLLQHASPVALAQYLAGAARGARPDVAILTIEELRDVENAPALRAALHNGFHKLVGEVVKPTPQRWVFSGEMLGSQLNTLDSDRVILAIHDLNTGTAQEWREALRELEQKLGAISRTVDQAARAQRRKFKLFRVALLVAKADKLPFVKYPTPSRFEDWCLLPFAQVGEALRPKPVEAAMFRMYLQEWAAVH